MRRERERVGAEIHFRFLALGAVSDDQRRSEPGADEEVRMAAERDGEGKGPAQPRQNVLHRIDRVHSRLDAAGDQVRDHLAVGLAFEGAAFCGELAAQFLVILDDAVVDDRHFARRVRVGIGRGRRAMRRPAGMGDARIAGRGFLAEHTGEIGELALGPAAHQCAFVQGADPGAVIAAIFHAPEAIEKPLGDRLPADDTHDAAHSLSPLKASRVAHPPIGAVDSRAGLTSCIASASPAGSRATYPRRAPERHR